MPTQEHKEKLSDEVRAWDQVNRALSRISGHEAWKEEFRGRMREPHKHHWMAWATSGQEDTIKKVLQEVRTEAVQTGQLLSAARALISAVDPEYWSQMLDLPHTSDGLDPRDIEALRQAAYGTPPAAEQHSLAHGHNHRRISHRAAYHYGTTKAAWEAGQAW
ncbi:hypothetical protein JCM10207_001309 [Rhodosporidiobolus poonsookiae]